MDPLRRDAFAVQIFTQPPALKQALDAFPGALYSVKEAHWIFPLEKYAEVVKTIEAAVEGVSISHVPASVFRVVQHLQARGPPEDVPWERLPSSLDTALMPFQREGVEMAFQRDGRILLGDEMGLGKTIQAIAIAGLYSHEWPLLICCPSSLRWQWKEQVSRWLPFLADDHINVVASNKDHADHRVNIVSYDMAAKMASELAQLRFGVVICDESHSLRNPSSVRYTRLGPVLKHIRRVILLTGTPALARPSELYTQLSILVPKLVGTKNEFGMRYCNGRPGAWGGMDFSGHSNLLELNFLLSKTVLIRRMKKDVQKELPPKRRQAVHLQVSKKEIKALEERLRQFRMVNLQDTYFDDNAVLNAAQRAARKSAIEFYNDCAVVRIEAVQEFLQDFLSTGIKCLIFGHHLDLLDAVEKVVKEVQKAQTKENTGGKLPDYIRIDGSTKPNARLELVGHFQKSPSCKVAILSMAVAGTGLEFTPCSTVVFAELCWTPGTLVQCEDRVHRMGQEADSVDIRYLLARNTCDELIWPMINRKLDVVGRTVEQASGTEGAGLDLEKNTEYARRAINQPQLDQWMVGRPAPPPPRGPMDQFLTAAPAANPHPPPPLPPSTSAQVTPLGTIAPSEALGHFSPVADSPPPEPPPESRKRPLPPGGDGVQKMGDLACPKRRRRNP